MNLEAFFITVLKPSLNEQVKSNVLHLFWNSGIASNEGRFY